MIIRTVKETDLGILAKMNSDIFGDTSEKQALEVFRDAIENGIPDACLVAEENEILGAVFVEEKLTFTENAAGIKSIFVKKGWQGKGIGKMLLEGCLSVLKEKGYKTVSLSVEQNNENAVSLYENLDFRPFRVLYLKEL